MLSPEDQEKGNHPKVKIVQKILASVVKQEKDLIKGTQIAMEEIKLIFHKGGFMLPDFKGNYKESVIKIV